MKILRINPRDVLRIRQEFLPTECKHDDKVFHLDEDEQSFHLGAFEENKLISVASFYFEKNPVVEGEYHYRLVGLATDPAFRKQGIASNILKSAFPIIKNNYCSKIWCHAHLDCVDFYQKNGFSCFTDSTQAEHHQLMIKEIQD